MSHPYKLVIQPDRGWRSVDLRALWEYRDLLTVMVRRDFFSKYKQTILGPAWFAFQPLVTTLMFILVFGKLAGIPTDGIPPALFYLCGLLGWNYFSSVFSQSSSTFVGNSGVFSKVYFPRLIVPLSIAISNLFTLGIQVLTFVAIFVYYKVGTPIGTSFDIQWQIIFAPLVIVQLAALGLGAGMWMTSMTAKYRDMVHLSGFLNGLWMYATPVIYPISKVGEEWRWLPAMNPLTMPVEALKFMFLGRGYLNLGFYGLSVLLTVAVLITGIWFFQRVEQNVVDTI